VNAATESHLTTSNISMTKQDFMDYNYNNYFISVLKKCLNDLNDDPTQKAYLEKILTDKLNKKKYLDKLMERKQELGKFAITKYIQDQIDYFNSHRLDMVWSRNFIETILFVAKINLNELSLFLKSIANLNGYLSYGLYFVRGGLDLLNLVKHVVLPSEDLQEFYNKFDVSNSEKFIVQWRLRYGRLMNDIVLWGPVNLATFHWLTGNGILGIAGNFLTVLLLVGDFAMTYISKMDKEHYHQMMQDELKSYSIEGLINAHHQKIINDLDFVMNYQLALIASFSLIAFALVFNPINIPLLVIGGTSCFVAQYYINLKNALLALEQEQNPHKQNMLYLDIAHRIFIQAAIPTMAICTGIFIIPMVPGIPMWFLLAANMVMASQMIQLTTDIVAWIKSPSQSLENIQKDVVTSCLRLSTLVGAGMILSSPANIIMGVLLATNAISIDILLNFIPQNEPTTHLKLS